MTFLRVTEVTAGAPGDLRPPPPMPERGAGGARRPIHTAALNTPPLLAPRIDSGPPAAARKKIKRRQYWRPIGRWGAIRGS